MPPPPELAAQRVAIDAVDHAILELLARRRELVADTFALKHTLGLPLLDVSREGELLDERRAFAAKLGIPAELVDALMRAILADSHGRTDIR